MLSVQAPAVSARPPVRTTGGVLPYDPTWGLTQDPQWVRLKQNHQVTAQLDPLQKRRRSAVGAQRLDAVPTALQLPARQTARFVEPPGYGVDDYGKRYVDGNYWNICVAGAATVAAFYFIPDPVELSGAFREPYGPFAITTRWDAADVDYNLGYEARARAYMLYMAMEVEPPSFDRPGMDDWSTYPTGGGSPQSIRDAVNWEISGHLRGGKWATYFYFIQENWGLGFSADRFNQDIVADIAGAGAPVIVTVDAAYLPNWSNATKPVHHAITIIGYDNVNDTYTYLDTCGKQCGSDTNGGTHEVSQRKMFKAIQMFGRRDEDGYTILRADGLPKYPNGAYIW
jgi:hypothetical protein